MNKEKKTIKSPEEVSKMIEDLWQNHKLGNKKPANNVFWVELPPLSEEEKVAIKAKKDAGKDKEDKPEDLYGVWIK